MLDALGHVHLAVEDLEAATRSYVALLGRSPSWRGEQPAEGTHSASFRLDNTTLELLAPTGSGGPLAAWLERRGPGLCALGFATDDAAAAARRLADQGLEPGEPETVLDRDVDSGAFRESVRVRIDEDAARGVGLEIVESRAPEAILPRAEPRAEESACVAALDHAVVRTADPDAAIALYGDGLGLRLALDRSFPQWSARLMFFRVGGVTVEVAASLADADAAGDDPLAAPLASGRDELWGLSWRVPDADAARARLAESGIDVSEVRTGRKPGTRVFTVRDGTAGIPTLMLEPPARDA